MTLRISIATLIALIFLTVLASLSLAALPMEGRSSTGAALEVIDVGH